MKTILSIAIRTNGDLEYMGGIKNRLISEGIIPNNGWTQTIDNNDACFLIFDF